MAKCAAAYSRRKPKDWYDIAYVLLHNDAGSVEAAADIVLTRFGSDLASVLEHLRSAPPFEVAHCLHHEGCLFTRYVRGA